MKNNNSTQYLRSVRLNREEINSFSLFPYCLPAISSLEFMHFHPKVTFLVGENGSGKSTILEAIAIAYGFNPEGGSKHINFETRSSHTDLHEKLTLVKGTKLAKDGFFLRAESFYNLASNLDTIEDGTIPYGGKSLHNQSHGESYFSTFLNRFGGNGLYLLDEPEAALSPSRQLSLLSIINDLVNKGSQFIIATHSPIIMAYPYSTIYEFKDGIQEVNYEDTDNFQITSSFINNREKMLNILLND